MHRALKHLLLPSRPPLRRLARHFSSDPSTVGLPSFPSPLTQESVLYALKSLDKSPQRALSFFQSLSTLHPKFSPSRPTISLLLRILAHKDHLKDFWLLLKTLENSGHSLDEPTYHILLSLFKTQKLTAESQALTKYYNQSVAKAKTDAKLDSAAKLILGSPEFDSEIEKKLTDINFNISEDVVAVIIRDVRSSPLKALKFFRWAAVQKPEYKHGAVAYNAMARVLGREDTITELWALVKEMKGVGVDMDIDTYVKILRSFFRAMMMKDAVELYEFMMDGPYKPAIQDCGLLLRRIADGGSPDMELVYRVVRKYEAAGFDLSKVVYDGIHRSLTRNGRFEEAKEIVKRMQGAGFELDNITYSQMIYGLCKAKKLDEACKVLDEMEEEGCVPDLKTWTVLIQGHCLAGEVDKAHECLMKMIGKGWEADADLLDVLVKGYCGEKRVDAAYTLFMEMVDKARLKPWQATYKYMIQELLKERKLEEGLKLLRTMKSQNFPPFADPFAPYISKFGTTEDVREFLKALSSNNYPSAAAYLRMFKAFFDEGRYSEAHDVLFKCPHHIRKDAEISKLFGSLKAGSAA